MLSQQPGLHLGQRDVAVGVDQPLQIGPLRIEVGPPRLTLSARLALFGFARPAKPDDRRYDPDAKPLGGMTGRQPCLSRGDHPLTHLASFPLLPFATKTTKTPGLPGVPVQSP